MMRLLFILFELLLCTNIFAEDTQWFKATELALKYRTYSGWTDWSEWKPVEVNVRVDFSQDRIILYSADPQIYRIVAKNNSKCTSDTVAFSIIDQDGDRGDLRLRFLENNDIVQLYVDFNNICWVYNMRLLNR